MTDHDFEYFRLCKDLFVEDDPNWNQIDSICLKKDIEYSCSLLKQTFNLEQDVTEFVTHVRELFLGKPEYIHDCNKCVFLGKSFHYDLYICNSTLPTLILRFSNKDQDYSSGLMFASNGFQKSIINQLTKPSDIRKMYCYVLAAKWAVERELLDPNWDKSI